MIDGVHRLTVLVMALLLAGCAGDDTAGAPAPTTDPPFTAPAGFEEPGSVAVSPGCAAAMSAAADEPDIDAAEPLIAATTEVCDSADEWVEALRQYPGAFGLTDDAVITTLELQIVCFDNDVDPSSPVCTDADAQGYLE